MSVASDASSSEEEDCLFLKVTIQNRLPCVWTLPERPC